MQTQKIYSTSSDLHQLPHSRLPPSWYPSMHQAIFSSCPDSRRRRHHEVAPEFPSRRPFPSATQVKRIITASFGSGHSCVFLQSKENFVRCVALPHSPPSSAALGQPERLDWTRSGCLGCCGTETRDSGRRRRNRRAVLPAAVCCRFRDCTCTRPQYSRAILIVAYTAR